jgi:hypothetical protein
VIASPVVRKPSSSSAVSQLTPVDVVETRRTSQLLEARRSSSTKRRSSAERDVSRSRSRHAPGMRHAAGICLLQSSLEVEQHSFGASRRLVLYNDDRELSPHCEADVLTKSQ